MPIVLDVMRILHKNCLFGVEVSVHRHSMTPTTTSRPAFELRCGGLYLAIQRVPGWLVAALATTAGSVLAAWLTSR